MAMDAMVVCYAGQEDKKPAKVFDILCRGIGGSIQMIRFAEKNIIPEVKITEGYLDFQRETSKEELSGWVKDGEIKIRDIYSNLVEFKDWLDSEVDYPKIEIHCYEWESGLD